MKKRGFTLLELLVVVAIVLLLAGLGVTLAGRAMEKSRVAKVRMDLLQVEAGLEMYYDDYKRYPPVRVSCNTAEREHWCELPEELVRLGYLPAGRKKGVSSAMEDPFNPGHTYKYLASGPYYLNGDLQRENYAVYIPDDFPACQSASGSYNEDAQSPLAWALWSLGPSPSTKKALSSQAPVSGLTWYRGTGDHGVIGRIKARHGHSFQTP